MGKKIKSVSKDLKILILDYAHWTDELKTALEKNGYSIKMIYEANSNALDIAIEWLKENMGCKAIMIWHLGGGTRHDGDKLKKEIEDFFVKIYDEVGKLPWRRIGFSDGEETHRKPAENAFIGNEKCFHIVVSRDEILELFSRKEE